MIFFDYIFYRSYISLFKTKYKHNAEPRSIAIVTIIQGSVIILFGWSILKLIDLDFPNNIHNLDNHKLKYIISLSLTFIIWHFNEKYYKKRSNRNYIQLRKKITNSIFNKIVPFWMIFLSPFIFLIGSIYIIILYS